MRVSSTLPFALLIFSSSAWAKDGVAIQSSAGISPVTRTETFPPADLPENLQVKIAFDAKADLYCVTRKYREGKAVPAPACRTAEAWNRSGLLGIDLPSSKLSAP